MNKPVLIGALFVLLVLLYMLFALGVGQGVSWDLRLDDNSKQIPYSLGMIKSLSEGQLGVQISEKKRVYELLNTQNNIEQEAYLFIGDRVRYNSQEANHVFEYVQAGGRVFISANYWPDTLIARLFAFEDCGNYFTGFSNIQENWQSPGSRYLSDARQLEVKSRFVHPSLAGEELKFRYETGDNGNWGYSWHYLHSLFICNENPYPTAVLAELKVQSNLQRNEFGELEGVVDLGEGNKNPPQWMPNFIRVQIGSGFLYLHSNPVLFSNYFLSSRAGLDYANAVLAHIDAEKLYWDMASRQADHVQQAAPPPVVHRTPMEYIFSQKPLRQAWYLLLLGSLAFVFFRGKRRQALIPIVQSPRNSSLAFVKTIARLYYQEQNHRRIFEKQMQFFLSHIRQRYKINTNDDSKKIQERLLLRTGVEPELVESIFSEYERIASRLSDPDVLVSAHTLNAFYARIEAFHQAVRKREEGSLSV